MVMRLWAAKPWRVGVRVSGHAQPALRWPYEFGGLSEETPEQEAAENAGQCRGGPHDGRGPGHPGPGGPGFSPNEDPAHERSESPEREAQEHSSTTSTTVAP